MDFNKYPGVAFETSGYFVRSDNRFLKCYHWDNLVINGVVLKSLIFILVSVFGLVFLVGCSSSDSEAKKVDESVESSAQKSDDVDSGKNLEVSAIEDSVDEISELLKTAMISQELEKYDDAAMYAQLAIDIIDESPSDYLSNDLFKGQAIQAYSAQCYNRFKLKQPPEVLENCSKLIELDPDDKWGYYYRGYTYAALSGTSFNSDGGGPFGQVVVVQNPLEDLSDSEIEKHHSVVDDLTEYIQIDDTTAVGPYNRRGNAYFALGLYENAIEDYSTATGAASHGCKWALTNSGIAHEKLEQYDEAKSAYEAALEIDSEWGWALDGLSRINEK